MQEKAKEKTGKMKPVAMKVDVDLLEHAEWNTHNADSFTDDSFKDLVESVRKNGIIQRVAVRKTGPESYEIIDGHRRVEAAKSAGIAEIECDVYEGMDDAQAKSMTLVCNIQRADNDPILEGELFGQMFVDGMGIEDVAAAIGKDVRYVARRARLQELIPEWKDAYKKEHVRPSVLEFVARHEPHVQKEIWENCSGYDLADIVVSDLKDDVDRLLCDLSKAKFDTEKCAHCLNNTACHPTLFGPDADGSERAFCQDGECFKRKANEEADGLILKLREKGTKVVAVEREWDVPDPRSDNPTAKSKIAYVYTDWDGFKHVKFGPKKESSKPAKTAREIAAEKEQKKREKAVRKIRESGFGKFREAFNDVKVDEFIDDIAGTEKFMAWAKAKFRELTGSGIYFGDWTITTMLGAMSDDARAKYCPAVTQEELDAILGKTDANGQEAN